MNGASAADAFESVSSSTCGMLRLNSRSKQKSASVSSRPGQPCPRISLRSLFFSSLKKERTSSQTPRSRPWGLLAGACAE
jgi:hypothetical protein